MGSDLKWQASTGLWRPLLFIVVLLQFGGFSDARKSWKAGRQNSHYRRAQGLAARDRNQAPGWNQQQQPGTAATEESFTLDFTAVEGNIDNFMAQIKSLAQSLYPCSSQKLNDDMKLHFLANTSVTCNDGTPAGYYIKESKGSRRWLIFLEGGWYCFSKENCDNRYNTMHWLMSSTNWPRSRTGTGMLSAQPEENPYWWNANIVFIPYCSSDVWSGASQKSEKTDYAFMGALIIQEVVKELLTKGLENAKILLLAGTRMQGFVLRQCPLRRAKHPMDFLKKGRERGVEKGSRLHPLPDLLLPQTRRDAAAFGCLLCTNWHQHYCVTLAMFQVLWKGS